MKLIIDSTGPLILSLVNDQILFYKNYQVAKSSAIIHRQIYQLLNSFQLQLSDIQELITFAGPGSYTGLRISRGIANTLKLFNIKHLSLYHYQVPSLIGIKKGRWMKEAFKGEIFNYVFDEQKEEIFLSKETTIDYQAYSSFTNNHLDTALLFKENLLTIVKKLELLNVEQPLLYYRKAEDEFKRR